MDQIEVDRQTRLGAGAMDKALWVLAGCMLVAVVVYLFELFLID